MKIAIPIRDGFRNSCSLIFGLLSWTMNQQPIVLFMALCIGILCTGCGPSKTTTKSKWVSIFNGKNMDGWSIKISGYPINENHKNMVTVEDGIMKIGYDQYQQWNNEFAHIFYKDKFSHYRLRMEYKFVGEQLPGGQTWALLNSGVMLHSQSPESMELSQNFPVSIEMQFLCEVDTLNRSTGNLASPGTHVKFADSLYTNHMLYSNGPVYPLNQWVSVEVVVLGDSIVHHIVEGDTVLTYRQPEIGGWELASETGWVEDKTWVTQAKGTKLSDGYIALQGESHPVHFRNIELMDLSGDYE